MMQTQRKNKKIAGKKKQTQRKNKKKQAYQKKINIPFNF